jgi:hypothetical protein
MEVQTANPPGSNKHLVPCGKRGQTSYYISQRFGRVQQDCNECEGSPAGFNEVVQIDSMPRRRNRRLNAKNRIKREFLGTPIFTPEKRVFFKTVKKSRVFQKSAKNSKKIAFFT